jgi:MoaA/NifB/PqqE/SkfB family radical SAM enzyme
MARQWLGEGLETYSSHPQHLPIVINQDEARRDAANDFQSARFNSTDIIGALGRLTQRSRDAAPEWLPLIGAIGTKPIGSFQNLAIAYAAVHGKAREPSPQCINAVLDLLLDGVDRRLQSIYRRFFSANPPQPGTSHGQKIAALQATRREVLAVLNCYDWQWLADWLGIGRIGETAETCVRRLANFAFWIDSVMFLFTHHCNISCRHCYNNSGPHKKAQRIPLARMLSTVAEMPAAGISCLNLTGGEPFLYPQDVLALIRAGRVAGLSGIGIFTNGFWAGTDERANQMLDRLAGAGFMQGHGDYIKVSAGVYHQEFIEFDRILIAARNYYSRFGKPLVIDFELEPQQENLADKIRGQIGAAGLADRVALEFRHIVRVGRATTLEGISKDSSHSPCCGISTVQLNPDGTVLPCGGFNHQIKGIRVGTSDQHSLKDLVKRMQNDPILQQLATKPLDQMLTHVAKEKRPNGYRGVCDLCQHALGDLTDKEPVQATLFAQQNFYPFWFTLAGDRDTGARQ